jgi:hypothetical protein
MKFKLTYEGLLFGASTNNTRAAHKHEMRKRFHPQLKRLWETAPALKDWIDYPNSTYSEKGGIPRRDNLANHFSKVSGYRFCPLITKGLGVHCDLDIVFLRTEPPGQIINSGDIDNRLKTIFDALRMPATVAELGGHSPDPGEDPFYCLLEDDNLVSNLSIQTATLLQPTGDDYDPNDSRLLISVTMQPHTLGIGNMSFL